MPLDPPLPHLIEVHLVGRRRAAHGRQHPGGDLLVEPHVHQFRHQRERDVVGQRHDPQQPHRAGLVEEEQHQRGTAGGHVERGHVLLHAAVQRHVQPHPLRYRKLPEGRADAVVHQEERTGLDAAADQADTGQD